MPVLTHDLHLGSSQRWLAIRHQVTARFVADLHGDRHFACHGATGGGLTPGVAMPIMQSRRIGMQSIFLARNGVSAYPLKYGKKADIVFSWRRKIS